MDETHSLNPLVVREEPLILVAGWVWMLTCTLSVTQPPVRASASPLAGSGRSL
jgi:hypothetical protein